MQPGSFNIRVGLCVGLALFFVSCGRRAANESARPFERPNIVFVLLDDARFDDFGFAGHPFVQTPNFDRIAREGAVFRNAFAATPLCSPNRASLLTGLYAHAHGIIDNVDRAEHSRDLITFPRLLQIEGYETAFIGKWHMGVDAGRRPGFDEWLSVQGQGRYFDPEVNHNGETKQLSGYATDLFSERSAEFISRKRNKPFLVYLSHKAVHPNIQQFADGSVEEIPPDGGFTPPYRLRSLYQGETPPRRPNAASRGAGKPALLRPIPGVPPLGPDTGTPDDVILNRLRMLTAADEGFGMILDAIERRGELDRTIIVVTSDHGYFYGEHGLNEERRLAYEEIIRTPLIVRYPPLVRAGREIDELVLSVDWAPTLLRLGGAQVPMNLHGRSLEPLLRGERPSDWRNSVLIEYFSDTVWPRLVRMGYHAVRTDRWKLIRYVELEGMDELYDLERDPYEMTNLIDDPAAAETRAELEAELDRLLRESGAAPE